MPYLLTGKYLLAFLVTTNYYTVARVWRGNMPENAFGVCQGFTLKTSILHNLWLAEGITPVWRSTQPYYHKNLKFIKMLNNLSGFIFHYTSMLKPTLHFCINFFITVKMCVVGKSFGRQEIIHLKYVLIKLIYSTRTCMHELVKIEGAWTAGNECMTVRELAFRSKYNHLHQLIRGCS